jgi:hypothetical protein
MRIAVAAVIAQPGRRRFEQLVPQAKLKITIYLTWKRMHPAGQGTRCTAGAALHADLHILGSEFCNLAVQFSVQTVIHQFCPLSLVVISFRTIMAFCLEAQKSFLFILIQRTFRRGCQPVNKRDKFVCFQRFLQVGAGFGKTFIPACALEFLVK